MHLGDHFWSGLEKLVYFVLFPALLFYAIARTRIDFAAAAPFVLSGVAAMGGGMLLGLLARPLFGPRPMVFASQFQCAYRFNSYIGLAVAAAIIEFLWDGWRPHFAVMGRVNGIRGYHDIKR